VITLGYPAPVTNVDLVSWPATASSGTVDAVVDSKKRRLVLRKSRAVVRGASVTVPAGAARDRWGNRNG
jgi:hypothetical protein